MLLRQQPNDLSKLIEVNSLVNSLLQQQGFYPVYFFNNTFYYPKIKEIIDCIKIISEGGEETLGAKNKI